MTVNCEARVLFLPVLMALISLLFNAVEYITYKIISALMSRPF